MPPQPSREIKALTGIRGVAACMVVFYHYFQDSSGLGPVHALIRHSYISVDLFFVLSGFVMALTYAPSFASGFSAAAYMRFLGKRLGRVYPLYAVVTAFVAACLAAGAIAGPEPSGGTFVSNILMVQAWGFGDSIGGPTWSISTEFAAYLVFPVLVWLVLCGTSSRCLLAMVVSTGALILLASTDAATLNQVTDGVASRSGPLDIFGAGTPAPLVRCLAGFVLGLAAFRLARLYAIRLGFDRSHVADAAALIVLLLWAGRGTDVTLELAFVALVIALATGDSWVGSFLSRRWVVWLGEISYSIYLVHWPVGALVRNRLMSALDAHHVSHAYTLSGLLPMALTFAVSAATFYGLEKPARDWTRRLMGGKARSISAEPAAP